MDVAGSAVGIASLGIQVCQGLLTYYDGWKSFHSDINCTYASIEDLSRTLVLLKASLVSDELDEEKKDRVKRCVHSCEESLRKLSAKSQKLRNHGQPQGIRQKAWADLQRMWYPLRASTLTKLREIVADVREQLQLAVQVLHLDVSTNSQRIMKEVATNTSNIVDRTVVIETSVTHISAQTQQILALQQSDQFNKIRAWLSPADPWTNHNAARQRHEPHTGTWLLQADQYQRWRAGDIHLLWLHGKAGCGKTVLCSTVIEDIKEYCNKSGNAMYAAFYFTFSDNQKQSYDDLLRSLITQLGWKEPGLSMLSQARERLNANTPAIDELEKILLACFQSYVELFLVLDALDECPDDGEVRRSMLEGLERVMQKAQNVRMFVTSREVTGIGDSMQTLGASSNSVATRLVDGDIERYISSQLSRDRRLTRFDTPTKNVIAETISRQANGMFRWAYCQLQELKKLPMARPSFVKKKLLALPATLDETYDRILTRIDQEVREQAIVLLQWLAYARSPPTLSELVEACIIDLSGEGIVQVDDRGDLEDTLNLLGELVTCGKAGDDDDDDDNDSIGYEDDFSDISNDKGHREGEDEFLTIQNTSTTWSGRNIDRSSRVRLAHFSVKEYLESKRIIQSPAKDFFLDTDTGNDFLAQSCLVYIMHYSSSCEKTSSDEDLLKFPLLRYAAQSWYYHSLNGLSSNVSREICLLQSEGAKRDWLLVHSPDCPRGDTYMFKNLECLDNVGSDLYYASFVGLSTAVSMLLDQRVDVNAQGHHYGNALQAASFKGYKKIVQMLLDAGADISAEGGKYGSALQAASAKSNGQVVQILLRAGADTNTQGGYHGSALQAASDEGDEEVVQMLLDSGADVNAQGGQHGEALENRFSQRPLRSCLEFLPTTSNHVNALQAASHIGHENVVRMLLDAGANINAEGGLYGTALKAASAVGYENVVRMLLDAGANVNAEGGLYGTALQTASDTGRENVVRMLLDAGANVNTKGGEYGTALQAASFNGNKNVVRMLLDAGANVNAEGGQFGTALQAASFNGRKNVVRMLLDAGANVNAEGGLYGTALKAALAVGYENVVQMLLDAGANVNAKGGQLGTALQAASSNGRENVVRMLLDAGANVNAEGGHFGPALQTASFNGHENVVRMLLDAGANVNAEGGQFGTSLQAASASCMGDENAVRMLLDAGANVNAEGGHYGTALQAASASYRGDENAVRMLLDAGANVNAEGGHYGTALKAALAVGHENVVQMLLDAGANVNAEGGRFGTVLQAASFEGDEKIVQMLLDAGADSNVQGGEYSSALQAASAKGHEKVVQTLLNVGVDVNAQGGRFGNALQAALAGGHEKVVRILKDAGADVNPQDGVCIKAQQAALVEGHEKE